jgi:hypothetical protein
MKKTYTACFLMVLGSIFYYGSLIGGNNPTCYRHGGYVALNSNPTTCSTSGCHIIPIGTDSSLFNVDTTSTNTTTGIADLVFREGLAAYPAVTSDVLKIVSTNASKGMTYTIYSLDGQVMLTDVLPSFPAMTFVDVHGLAAAQYVVKVYDADHSTTFRIVKN